MVGRKNRAAYRATRRQLLQAAGAAALGLASRPAFAHGAPGQPDLRPRFGPPVADPGGLLDLPPGFQYRLLSPEGARLASGAPVPGRHDGMAAFRGRGGTTMLVRNHELAAGDPGSPVAGKAPYDRHSPGGTVAVIVSPQRRELRSFVASSGTLRNCAGGATPWGTWITCEETRTTGHGYCFEVLPEAPESRLSRQPIRAMGFFSHEAVAVDPRTGAVYLTEDSPGRSFLYRFLPRDRRGRPGSLRVGGTLQALAVEQDPGSNTRRVIVRWVTVPPEQAPERALERGAHAFGRLEGCHFGAGALWFSDTVGGAAGLGQVFRLTPERRMLELFLEASDANTLERPDNVVVAPWGDVWLAEDGAGENRLIGIGPHGPPYTFARNRLNESELAGPCFAPDGRTFFVNIQTPGLTLAIWGPFPRRG